MQTVKLGILLALLTSCGSEHPDRCVVWGEECRSPGKPGKDGVDGPAGEAGAKGDTGAPGVAGDKGEAGQNGAQGPRGEAGPAGVAGERGPQGETGPQGAAAVLSQYSVTEVVDPCGDGPGFDEVLLRMSNGQLLAHYTNGHYQFLTIVAPGHYSTTDQQECHFTINTDLSISY